MKLTVGAVIREPLLTTLRFVSWYLDQGADEIILCFDDPNDPSLPILSRVEKVTCVPCTDAFWPKCGMTSDRRFTRRQNKAMEYFYRRAASGWFLHVDGDELLHLQGRRLRDMLGYFPDDVRGVLVQPAEALCVPGDVNRNHFRLPMSRQAIRAVYGDLAGVMRPRGGLTGHHVGKTVTRTGYDTAHMRQHYMHFDDRSMLVDRVFGPAEGAFLLHFVDQGFEVWKSKLLWRLSARGFAPPMEKVVRNALDSDKTEKALWALYAKLHVFDTERLGILETHKAHYSIELQFSRLMRQHFPGYLNASVAPTLRAG